MVVTTCFVSSLLTCFCLLYDSRKVGQLLFTHILTDSPHNYKHFLLTPFPWQSVRSSPFNNYYYDVFHAITSFSLRPSNLDQQFIFFHFIIVEGKTLKIKQIVFNEFLSFSFLLCFLSNIQLITLFELIRSIVDLIRIGGCKIDFNCWTQLIFLLGSWIVCTLSLLSLYQCFEQLLHNCLINERIIVYN